MKQILAIFFLAVALAGCVDGRTGDVFVFPECPKTGPCR